ncbi:MAG: GDP-L-fucose synthase [Methanobacteriaceae archaeon]|jgi:GDP-L-fucose synthase|nr:GDP-L-fucose synthase [Candidatus Methanorudis spinitermitis]
MDYNSKIYVAGHNGMVGSAIIRNLKKKNFENIITRSSSELDLRDQKKVNLFFKENKLEYVILAAARVGGINANMNDLTGFLLDNLSIQTNVINAAYINGTENLLFLGSSCIYPKNAPQPLKEEYLLSGPLEPTNEGYAIAKIAGLKACEYLNKEHGLNYISIMPPNLYGINDNFDPETSHVLSAILKRIHDAKEKNKPSVKIWGTGNPYREFMYVDDMADASVFLLENYHETDFINVGVGKDITISNLAKLIKEIVGYGGELVFDSSKPDGMYRKLLDISKIKKLGWSYKTSLRDGITKTYNWYLENIIDTNKK